MVKYSLSINTSAVKPLYFRHLRTNQSVLVRVVAPFQEVKFVNVNTCVLEDTLNRDCPHFIERVSTILLKLAY